MFFFGGAAHFPLVYGASAHLLYSEPPAAELEDAAASALGRFAAAPAAATAPAFGLAPAKLFFAVVLYAILARAELSSLLALWAVTQLSTWSSLQGQFRIAHGYSVAGTTRQ